MNLPEIGSERYFFSWRESTRLFLKSQGRVPRTSEMNPKKPAAGYGKRLGPAALRGNSKLHIARASPVEPGGNDATRELEREAQVLA